MSGKRLVGEKERERVKSVQGPLPTNVGVAAFATINGMVFPAVVISIAISILTAFTVSYGLQKKQKVEKLGAFSKKGQKRSVSFLEDAVAMQNSSRTSSQGI